MVDELSSMFHEGHRELQDRFDGRRMADALENHLRFEQFRDEDIQFIEQSEFFFLATAHSESVDCSFKGGPPGFVRVTGPQHLEWQDYDGNSMYRSLGNILKSPRIGILFIQFGANPRRLRINGKCTLADRAEKNPKLIVKMEADEIFPNCPRYVPDLSNNNPSPYLPNANGVGPKPKWKSFEFLRNILPEHDPHKDKT